MLSLRAQPWNKQYMAHVQHLAASSDGSQVSKSLQATFLQRIPGLTGASPRDFQLFPPTVHHYVLAASLTGPVMHCAIWGLRHKLDQEQHRTVCAGPARARFGSIAWPSDSFFGSWKKGTKAQSLPLASPASCYISTYSRSHDCRRPIAVCHDPPCRVEV